MTRPELLAWLRAHKLGVEASLHGDGRPQAAVVGIAVSDELELVFDTVTTSRKYDNLRRDPRCAFVWWDGDVTVQLEGLAEEMRGADVGRAQTVYFAAFPDGPERAAWPTIAYFRVRPTWIRTSDFSASPPRIIAHFGELAP
jgi:pyridoxine/pyridoxamine 5'-phosphate oxidase